MNLTLRLDPDMYEELRKEAFERRTTITAVIRDRINAVKFLDLTKGTDVSIEADGIPGRITSVRAGVTTSETYKPGLKLRVNREET